jgi:hypothetical protein
MAVIEGQGSEPDSLQIMSLVARMCIGMLCYIVLIYSLVIFLGGTSIMVLIRYYTKFFTDQGYLTFTLPVRRSTQFWSKAIAGFVYTAASGVVALISILMAIGSVIIALVITPNAAESFPIEELTSIFTPANGVCGVIALLLAILLIAAIVFASMMMNYLVITLAATMFRKLKLLSVLVTYYVVNYVLMIPAVYITTYYGMFSVAIGAAALPKLFANAHIGMGVIYLALIVAILATLCVGVSLAIFNLTRIERKLNLA